MINVQRKAFQWNNAYNDMESVEHHQFLASLSCYLFFCTGFGGSKSWNCHIPENSLKKLALSEQIKLKKVRKLMTHNIYNHPKKNEHLCRKTRHKLGKSKTFFPCPGCPGVQGPSGAALLSVGGTIGAWLFQEFLQDDLTCLKCPKSSSHQVSMDWFNGKIAENPYIWWEKIWFQVTIFPPIHWQVSMNPFPQFCCFRKSCCRCINLSSDFGMMLGSIPSGFRASSIMMKIGLWWKDPQTWLWWSF